jgi:hypothetical protein
VSQIELTEAVEVSASLEDLREEYGFQKKMVYALDDSQQNNAWLSCMEKHSCQVKPSGSKLSGLFLSTFTTAAI